MPETRLFMRTFRHCIIGSLLTSSIAIAAPLVGAESRCVGTTSNGRIENSVQLPTRGANFAPYSLAGVSLGRTYVHSRVHDAVVDAYRALEKSRPQTKFVYGETGWKSGGRFKPHRTHQNGLSVDFFVPVLNEKNQSVTLPTNALNKWGYDLEFDRSGRMDELRIDFDALGEHLYQLDVAAKKHRAPIKLVILDPRYFDALFRTTRGAHLKANVRFMQKDAWVRHDDHYHVDFDVACKPMTAPKRALQ